VPDRDIGSCHLGGKYEKGKTENGIERGKSKGNVQVNRVKFILSEKSERLEERKYFLTDM
jgi:hypothetical protein